MTLRDISFLVLAWAGAAVISYLVYDWRQENDIDDLRDRLGDVENDLGLGDAGDLRFEPDTRAGGGLRIRILSASDEDESIPGIMEVRGSARVEIENITVPEPVAGPDLEIIGTTGDGGACNVLKELSGFAAVHAGQHDDLTLKWDCDDLASLTIAGVEFTAAN